MGRPYSGQWPRPTLRLRFCVLLRPKLIRQASTDAPHRLQSDVLVRRGESRRSGSLDRVRVCHQGQDSTQTFPESRHCCPNCTFSGTGREAAGRGVGVLVFH